MLKTFLKKFCSSFLAFSMLLSPVESMVYSQAPQYLAPTSQLKKIHLLDSHLLQQRLKITQLPLEIVARKANIDIEYLQDLLKNNFINIADNSNIISLLHETINNLQSTWFFRCTNFVLNKLKEDLSETIPDKQKIIRNLLKLRKKAKNPFRKKDQGNRDTLKLVHDLYEEFHGIIKFCEKIFTEQDRKNLQSLLKLDLPLEDYNRLQQLLVSMCFDTNHWRQEFLKKVQRVWADETTDSKLLKEFFDYWMEHYDGLKLPMHFAANFITPLKTIAELLTQIKEECLNKHYPLHIIDPLKKIVLEHLDQIKTFFNSKHSENRQKQRFENLLLEIHSNMMRVVWGNLVSRGGHFLSDSQKQEKVIFIDNVFKEILETLRNVEKNQNEKQKTMDYLNILDHCINSVLISHGDINDFKSNLNDCLNGKLILSPLTVHSGHSKPENFDPHFDKYLEPFLFRSNPSGINWYHVETMFNNNTFIPWAQKILESNFQDALQVIRERNEDEFWIKNSISTESKTKGNKALVKHVALNAIFLVMGLQQRTQKETPLFDDVIDQIKQLMRSAIWEWNNPSITSIIQEAWEEEKTRITEAADPDPGDYFFNNENTCSLRNDASMRHSA